MGRILILEPQPEIRELIEHVVLRLGHEPLTQSAAPHERVDAVVLEPQSARGLGVAHKIQERFPEIPIVCVSVLPPTPETRRLTPGAYLMKPFSLEELERALSHAVAASANR